MRVWSVVADLGTENAHIRAVLLFEPDTPFLDRHFKANLSSDLLAALGYTTIDVVESQLEIPDIRTRRFTPTKPTLVADDFARELPGIN